MNRRSKQTAVTVILKALIPYSRENLMLSFKPNKFFSDLERNTQYNQNTLRNAYWRAGRHGYIQTKAGNPQITKSGYEKIEPYQPRHLGKSANLIVIFDIPEEKRSVRQQFREFLKTWEFIQIQKSVWATDKDYRGMLIEAVSELRLAGCIEIYESVRLFPKK